MRLRKSPPPTSKDKVWPLPAADLLYAGRATNEKLARYGVRTIGDIAHLDPESMQRWFGVNGLYIWRYAAGLDTAPVMNKDFVSPVKSVGHGITCVADLLNEEEVWKVMLELSQDIGHRLRIHKLKASGGQIAVRSNDLSGRQFQGKLGLATQSPMLIAEKARVFLWSITVGQRLSVPSPSVPSTSSQG